MTGSFRTNRPRTHDPLLPLDHAQIEWPLLGRIAVALDGKLAGFRSGVTDTFRT